MKTIAFDYFEIDGIRINNIGHEMLKSQNQLDYNISPGRQTDFSMKNIEDYQTGVIPQVEFGFKFIPAEEYLKLRSIVLAKRVFNIRYYDKDFNCIVRHDMYVKPDNLTAFYSLGSTDIEGVRDFVIQFVATLNEDDMYFANFEGVSEEGTKWGRSVLAPAPYSSYNTNKFIVSAEDYHRNCEMKLLPELNGYTFKLTTPKDPTENYGVFAKNIDLLIGHKYTLFYKIKNNINNINLIFEVFRRNSDDGAYLPLYLGSAKGNETFIADTNTCIVQLKIFGNVGESIDIYDLGIVDLGGYWQDKQNQNAKYYPNSRINVFKNIDLHWETTYLENIFALRYDLVNKEGINLEYNLDIKGYVIKIINGTAHNFNQSFNIVKGKKYKFSCNKDGKSYLGVAIYRLTPSGYWDDKYTTSLIFETNENYISKQATFIADTDQCVFEFTIQGAENEYINIRDLELIDLGYVEEQPKAVTLQATPMLIDLK